MFVSGDVTKQALKRQSYIPDSQYPEGSLIAGQEFDNVFFSGGEITGVSISDLSAPLPILDGGTGATTANAALNALLPDQTGNSGKFLKTDGTNTSWEIDTDTGITQLTGDVTAGPGSGSQAATLATVNSNVGLFGSSTSIPTVTVNAKGLITAASGNAVVAPAGTLTGTTLNSSVINSSLTSVGTLTNLTVTNPITGSVTGNAATATTLQTPRAIYGNNFDGSTALSQVIASTYGGTANGFTKFSGPTTTEKTFTLPNANATILTDNAVVTVGQGGSGSSTAAGARTNFDVYSKSETDTAIARVEGTWTATHTGAITGTSTAYYRKNGKTVTVQLPTKVVAGASSANPITISGLPYAPNSEVYQPVLRVNDNGSPTTTVGMLRVTISSSIIIYKDMALSNFTSSSANTGYYGFTFTYTTAS